jgi:hypothetical protein
MHDNVSGVHSSPSLIAGNTYIPAGVHDSLYCSGWVLEIPWTSARSLSRRASRTTSMTRIPATRPSPSISFATKHKHHMHGGTQHGDAIDPFRRSCRSLRRPRCARAYDKPVATMRGYLDAMDRAPYRAAPPALKPLRVLAALGPQMLRLAAERADGAHPYNTTPKHTAQARELLGAVPLLCPEQAVILETNAAKARAIARKFLAIYLTLPNYTNNFLRLGFSEADFANGGSDGLIDAVIAWGGVK